MNQNPHIAVVGATGAVGIEMIKTLEKRNFPVGKLTLLASARSVGKKLKFRGESINVEELKAGAFKGIDVAFVFGSLASGAGKAASDVDLLIIGDAGLRALSPALRRAADAVGREINPVTMTIAEFRKRRTKDPFLADVLGKEKLFLKGGAGELERLG